MQVYIFTANSLKDIKIGIANRCWAVEELKEPHAWARLGRSRQMPIGAPGLFFSSAEPEAFTTPFVVESHPEDRAIALWEQPRYLPFSIRPIGDVRALILLSHAIFTWPNLRGVENVRASLNLSPALEFTPTFVPRYDWDLILEQFNLDPDEYEDVFTTASTVLQKKE